MSGELYAEGYFVIIPEWVLDADISDKAVRLYGVLRSYADHRTGVAFPSRRTLAGRLRIADVKGVDRALAELEELGAVEVKRAVNAPGETRTSNRYLLRHTPRGADAIPPSAAKPQTASSDPRGADAIGGADATPPMAPAPHPQGRQRHRGRGASAPLTKPRELKETPTGSPTAPAELAQLRLVEEGQDRADLERTVNELSAEHWEAVGRVVPFPGVRAIVKAALTAGHPEAQIRAALGALRRQRRTLTKNALGLLLASPETVSVGAYGAHRPYRDPDPSTPGAFPERF